MAKYFLSLLLFSLVFHRTHRILVNDEGTHFSASKPSLVSMNEEEEGKIFKFVYSNDYSSLSSSIKLHSFFTSSTLKCCFDDDDDPCTWNIMAWAIKCKAQKQFLIS